MVECRMLGHRYRFSAFGETMQWECQRGCGAGGMKQYGSPAEAARYAAAFDREDRDQLGKRGPLVATFPLRVWYRLRSSRARQR